MYIETEFDLSKEKEVGTIEDYYLLHNSKANKEIRSVLTDETYKLFLYPFTFTHYGSVRNRMEAAHLLKRYFGEKYAFYYLFLCHFFTYLVPPAILSIILIVI
jgi:hypothetical protein